MDAVHHGRWRDLHGFLELKIVLLAAVVVGTSVHAAPATWESVKAHFPPITLPLTSKSLPADGPALTPKEVLALGVKKSTSVELETLRHYTTTPEPGEKHQIVPLGSLVRDSGVVLVLRYDVSFGVGNASYVVLLSMDPKGVLLDGYQFCAAVETEAGLQQDVSTFTAAGTLGRRKVITIPMHEEGLPETVVIVAEDSARLTRNGTFEATPEAFATRDGAFVDPKTHEELRAVGPDIFYRANETKPFQKLEREGDTVRFKPGGKSYQLSWDEARKVLSCLNPDGSLQRFPRTW